MSIDASPGLDQETIDAVSATIDPIPASVARLAELVARSDINASQIVELISREPRLAADVIARANMADLIGREPVTTVRIAVARLGFATTLSVALGQAAKPVLLVPLEPYGLLAGELWLRAVTASVGAEVVASYSPTRVPGEALTGALLHEIGKVAICRHFGEATLTALQREAERRPGDSIRLERTVLGADHAALGALVIRSWGLPSSIADAVADYPKPVGAASHAASVVHVAHLLGVAGTRPDAAVEVWDELEQGCRALGLRCDGPDELITAASVRLEAVSAQL